MPRSFAQLPGYDIVARIGRGAGATIYQARKQGSRDLATVKHVVRHGPKDDRFIEQAEIEYTVGHKLDHPLLRRALEVVRVKKWLKTQELFLVLEYVDGVRLEDQRPESLERMVSLFLDIADGLNEMHKGGYAHADIKPNNVLLTKDGGVKIIDFGQSCELGTAKARIQGTPDFMAPEQTLRQPIDQRTDVFNLGATMYWVTTGKWFRTMMNAGATATKKIEVDARSGNQPPHELNPRVPVTLSQLIMDCCAERKDDRPRDMKQVRSRLDIALHLLAKKQNATGSTA